MRLSVNKEDPGYHPRATMAKVILNGVEINSCFTADEELGEVHCFMKGPDNKFILNASRTELLKEVKRGKVEIILPGVDC